MGADGLLVHSDAFSPDTVVDTLGAGDTFNAAVILALSRGESSFPPSTQHKMACLLPKVGGFHAPHSPAAVGTVWRSRQAVRTTSSWPAHAALPWH